MITRYPTPIINNPGGTVNIYSGSNNSNDGKPVNTPSTKNNKSMVEYSRGIEVKLKSCMQRSKQINCKFSVKNTAKDDKTSYIYGQTFLIDSESEKYKVSIMKFGKVTNSGSYTPDKLLIKGIPVKTELILNKVTSFGSTVPLLKFHLVVDRKTSILEFRNIPLFH